MTTTPRSWTLELPPTPNAVLLTSNQRMPWRPRARLTRDLRRITWALATNTIGPVGLDRVRIVATVHPGPRTSRFDPHNWQPTVKAAIDGLVDAGVLADDDATRVTEVAFVAGPRAQQRTRLSLTITEVTE